MRRWRWDDIPEGALVMPTDDDDWFAPHAAEALERMRPPDITAYVWEASFAETPDVVRPPPLPHPPRAVALDAAGMELLHQQLRDGEEREHLRPARRSHAASAWVDGAAPGEVLYLPDRLSMVNRTIASRTQLSAGDRSHPSTPAEMRRKLARYRRRYGRIDLSDAPWARPYVAMIAELTGELEPRALSFTAAGGGNRPGPTRAPPSGSDR